MVIKARIRIGGSMIDNGTISSKTTTTILAHFQQQPHTRKAIGICHFCYLFQFA